jgi:hypothetical protein
MRSSRPRSPRRFGTRPGRSAYAGRRTTNRRHSVQPYTRPRPAAHQTFWKILIAGVLVLVVGLLAHLLSGQKSINDTDTVARQFVYTAPTANDAAITLPQAVRNDLRDVALAHRRIALTRVESNGGISTSAIDMTPRAGESSSAPVLKVGGRVREAVDAKITSIESAMNSSAASGGRALYAGLTKISFSDAPVTIVSSGLDLSAPTDFRKLAWRIPAEQVVAGIKKAGALAALRGQVLFVVVPTAGVQSQLGQAQKTYREGVWKSLLSASGATSVTFVDALGTAAGSTTPAPSITVPGLPTTPIPRVVSSTDPKTVTCTVRASYFVVNTARLIDTATTARDLRPCVTDARAAGAMFKLDGWTSYDGPLTKAGRPAVDSSANRRLSSDRVHGIVELLVNALGVPRSKIVRRIGHGNVNQPDADPRSPSNRVVIITYTTK